VGVTEADEWRALARRCRGRREELGLSQLACADAAGMPRVSYTTFEAGSRKLYTHELSRLARFLRVSVDWLLDMPTALPPELATIVAELPPEHVETLVTFAGFLWTQSQGRHALPTLWG
jgi:transcriptional regulator with XRE-family HTH domain